jgi:hypothetical protein
MPHVSGGYHKCLLLIIIIIIISILYFNLLTQQLQEPITESAQGNNKCTKNAYA